MTLFETASWDDALGDTIHHDIFKASTVSKTKKKKKSNNLKNANNLKKNGKEYENKKKIDETVGKNVIGFHNKQDKIKKNKKGKSLDKDFNIPQSNKSPARKIPNSIFDVKKEKLLQQVQKQHKNKKNKILESVTLEQPSTTQLTHKSNFDARKKEKRKLKLMKLKEQVQTQIANKSNKEPLSLRQRMMLKLKAARFRFLNEQIYTTTGTEAQNLFTKDPEAFLAYHEGYRQQVEKWPVNPVDVIISSIRKMPKSDVIADFGCGEAKLSTSVQQKVHSFDLVAANESVITCDMAHVPLEKESVNVAVFCLSLMGTNLQDYLLEANRVLKVGGLLKIAEVESRFGDVDNFIEGVERFGFKKCWKDLSHNLFYFIDFKKDNTVKNKKKLPTVSLQPCLYKKR